MRVGIVSRCDQKEAIKLAADIAHHLNGRATTTYDECTGHKLGSQGIPLSQMETDVIIAIGGDGTILRILQELKHPIPIIGINVGKVGFLADVSPNNAIPVVDDLLSGFRVSAHSRLSISLNSRRLPPATNEAVIITSQPAHMLEYSIEVDGRVLDTLRADGVIVATSTGSTAYAMSAGGPIVDPRVDAFIIVSLAPYKLSVRPWVVFGESIVKVRITENDAAIVIDGQYNEAVHEADEIIFRKDEQKSLFVIADQSFFVKVMSKLR
ncbi:MAG: NAD(+)/NADH kinase [Euryarchaeota archaeon]|nr:NAD(+)/NADH kinase [Euryarchaeota archaeon]